MDRIEAVRQAERPLPTSLQNGGFPSFRAIHADVLKGTVSCRIGLSECEHRPASNSQHVRNGLCNETFPACQALIHVHSAVRHFSEILVRNHRFRRPEPGAGAAGPYHHYTWELFALDTKLSLGPDATRAEVLAAMDGHVVAKAALVGRFHR